ncbi:ASPIC/UnbV domain-containing protein [Verrucomicrobia bacterium]|nr:ASPIC/UnbV domain-containing protein [Verrucomicrobiota bacterium]
MAQSSIPMYFGLGTATKVDAVEVQWPSGIIQRTQAQVEPNQTLTLREPDDGRIP